MERSKTPGDGPLTAARGRRASAPELRSHLATAPPAFLEGALENPEMTADEMALLLKNRMASATLLTRVGRDRRWMRYYQVRRGVVRHPRTPFPVARALLGNLYWRDLAETSEDARIHPAVRRQAESVLRERLPEITVGEQISLARRASAGLIEALGLSGDPRVLRALLDNPRVKERDAVAVAARDEAPGEALGWLAGHAKWGIRRSVRMALLRNPRTPIPAALKLLAKLPREDLEGLASDDDAPQIVRVGARRQMGDDSQGPETRRSQS